MIYRMLPKKRGHLHQKSIFLSKFNKNVCCKKVPPASFLCHVPTSSDMVDYLGCLLRIHYFLFFFIIIDFDQIKLWFSQKRFSAIGRTLQFRLHYKVLFCKYHTFSLYYIFSWLKYVALKKRKLHKVRYLPKRVLVILHDINGILGSVKDTCTCML